MMYKNSFLTRYKDDISAKQKIIRERLGVPATITTKLNDDLLPEPMSSSTPQREPGRHDRDNDSIPSIDDEDNPGVTRETIQERNYRSKASFFSDDAEESLQFFKKNLSTSDKKLSTQIKPRETQPIATSAKIANRSHRPWSTKPDPEPKPRLPQNTNLAAESQDRSRQVPSRSQHQSKDLAPDINDSGTYRPLPIKQTSISSPRDTNAIYTKNAQDRSKIPIGYDKRRPIIVDEPIETQLDANINDDRSENSFPNEFLNYQSTDGRRSAEGSSRTGSFSRKPLYNSILRDSIRLKVNRSKVHQTESKIERESRQPVEQNNEQSSESNERAVDVKRSSLRKSKKKNKAEKDDESTEKVPLRNFTDVRVVKITRTEIERSLGITVKADDGNIVVARIMAGSLVDKQGALQVGDLILSVNGREIYTPEQLQDEIRRTINEDTVLMKIVASDREELPSLCIYLRALFSYDPNEDSLLPCKEVGVAFNKGDILEIVNQEDPNWWQARRVESENLQTGLIPSQELEERRRAFVIPDYDLATRTSICGTKVLRKSKKKEIYNLGQNNDFDKAEMQLYEEVCRTPAFERRTLVLIGANGVGKQALKARIVTGEPDRFGTPLAHTSRLPRDGEENGLHYHFVTREMMEEDILAGRYLEYGEYDGALYGTKLDSVREIIGSGKVCVLDCSATCLKILKTPDYLPFVAFIGAPTLDQLRYMNDWGRSSSRNYSTFDRALVRQSRRARTLQDFAFDFFEDEDLQLTVEESARLFRMYENYFDIVLINNNFERTYELLREAMDALSMTPQWIPISWIYSSSSGK